MGTIADSAMDVCARVLNNYGFEFEDIHLIGYDEWKPIEKDMEYELRQNDLDLSFTSDFSDKYNIKLSGNRGGMVNTIRNYYKSQHSSGWKEMGQLREIDLDQAPGFYKDDRFGFPEKITRDQFVNLVSTRKNETTHMGIGSQASIIETKVTIYIDYSGNLMFDQFSFKYD